MTRPFIKRARQILKPRFVLPLAAIVLVATIGGCVYLSELVGLGPRPPIVHLKSVELAHVTSGTIEMRLVFDVQNPNGFKVDIKRIDYQMTIRDRKIAIGRFDKLIEIEGNAVTPVKIPLRLDTGAILFILKDYVRDPKGVVVKLKGEVEASTSFGTWIVPVEQEKTIIQAPS